MNITNVALSPFKSERENVLPETVSNKTNEGAMVPRGIIVDGVAAM